MSVVCCFCGARYDRYTPIICEICANRKFKFGNDDYIIEFPDYRPKTFSFVLRPRLINF